MYTESMAGPASTTSKPKASVYEEKELARLQKQDYWLQVSRAKLVMDLIFVCEFVYLIMMCAYLIRLITAYEVFNIRRGKDFVKTFTGLTAAILRCATLFLL